MLENAKDLINKGKLLKDQELIEMGLNLLEQYSPKEVSSPIEPTSFYVCENCGHNIEADKPRKKCPACGKHKLILVEENREESIETEPELDRDDLSTFITQTRKPENSRIRYDDNGEISGTYTKAEPVKNVINAWDDKDKEEGQDKANELLKQFTRISPRTRQPITMVNAKCDVCGKEEKVHPIHVHAADGRKRYVCNRCVGRRRV
jgi:predicted Zn-ribbon and HTH transcriptional regulator